MFHRKDGLDRAELMAAEWKNILPPWAKVSTRWKGYIEVDADIVFPHYAKMLGYDLKQLTFEKIEVMMYCYLEDLKKLLGTPLTVKETPGKIRRRWDRRRYPHEPPLNWREEYRKITKYHVGKLNTTIIRPKPKKWKRRK